jgi:hypothetical protein
MRINRWFSGAAAAAILVFFSAGSAEAAPLTFSCPVGQDCNGATIGLGITSSTNLGGGLYEYTLVYGIDLSGYAGDSTDYLQAIAFKGAVDGNLTNLSMTTTAPGAWDLAQHELNNDCSHGDAKSTCAIADAGGNGAPVVGGPTYYWFFTFDSTDPSPNANVGDIKFRYVDTEGKFVGNLGSFSIPLQQNACLGTDCDVTVTPEPASLLMFGTGLAGVARVARRRTRKRRI